MGRQIMLHGGGGSTQSLREAERMAPLRSSFGYLKPSYSRVGSFGRPIRNQGCRPTVVPDKKASYNEGPAFYKHSIDTWDSVKPASPRAVFSKAPREMSGKNWEHSGIKTTPGD